jgi:hypothetical protein
MFGRRSPNNASSSNQPLPPVPTPSSYPSFREPFRPSDMDDWYNRPEANRPPSPGGLVSSNAVATAGPPTTRWGLSPGEVKKLLSLRKTPSPSSKVIGLPNIIGAGRDESMMDEEARKAHAFDVNLRDLGERK